MPLRGGGAEQDPDPDFDVMVYGALTGLVIAGVLIYLRFNYLWGHSMARWPSSRLLAHVDVRPRRIGPIADGGIFISLASGGTIDICNDGPLYWREPTDSTGGGS